MNTQELEHLVLVGLRGAVLDIDEAHRAGRKLPLKTIEDARDILSGILDKEKELA